MATDVERLAVLIEANTKSYERAMRRIEQKTDQAFKRSSKSVGRLDRSMAAAAATARRFAAGFAAAFASGAGFRAIQTAINDLDRLAKTADKVGLSIEFLQAMRFGAEQTGVEIRALDMGMQRFSRRVAEAANGTGELLNVIEANNIQLRDADGNMRRQEDILRDYADLIASAGSEQEALALAFKAFDSEGAALVNTFRNGSAAIDDYVDAVRRLGTNSEEAAREAERLNDAFNRLSHRAATVFKEMAVGAGGFVEKLVEELQIAAYQIDRFIGNPLNPSNLNTLADDGTRERAMDRLGARLRFGAPDPMSRGDAADFYDDLFGITRPTSGGVRLIDDDDNDRRKEAIDLTKDLKRATDDLSDSHRFFNDIAFDGLSSIIVHGENAEDVMRRLATSIADAALQAALFGQGPLGEFFGRGIIGGAFGRGAGIPLSQQYGVGIPVYHSGTPFVPETGPAILQRGERVVPANQNYHGGGTVVNIHNYDGSKVREEQRQGPGGQETVDVFIGEMNKAIAAGKMDQSMGGRFGARVRGVVR